MSAKIWFVSVNGTQGSDQLTTEEVREVVAANPGAVILVWKEGLAGWVEADSVPELAPAPAPKPTPAAEKPAPAEEKPKAASAARRAPVSSSAAKAPAPEALRQPVGFLRALFDVRFESFVTPKMISLLYILAMVGIGLGFLFMVFGAATGIITGVRFSMWGKALLSTIWLLLTPVVAIIYLAMARMLFEVVIVLFKIKDNTARMAGD